MNTASKRAAKAKSEKPQETVKPLKGGEDLFENETGTQEEEPTFPQVETTQQANVEKQKEELIPTLEFANESFSSYEFMKWVLGDEITCRLAGFLCHPDDESRHPDFKYTESDHCKDDRDEFKQYYMLEMLDEKFKPTGAFVASNTYWGLEQFFTDKIQEHGAELTRYVLKIALVNEIQRKSKTTPLKVFSILRATTASLPIVQK